MRKKNNPYWTRRARLDKLKVIAVGEAGIDELKRILKKNLDDVQKKIKDFYDKYGDNPAENLTYAQFQIYKARLKAQAKLNPQDKTLQRLAKQDIPKYRIDRLRALETDLQIQLTHATKAQEAGIAKTLKQVGEVAQATTALRFKDTVGVAFNKISSEKMTKIIYSSWSGESWSNRIWADRDYVGKKVQRILEKGVPQGTSLQTMSKELAEATNQSFNNSFRLMRTETSHIDGQVLLESFKQAQRELGYTRYIFDATIDNRTSAICGGDAKKGIEGLDGKTFAIDDAEIGVNFPPMHPNCRSTAVLDESSIDESLIEE